MVRPLSPIGQPDKCRQERFTPNLGLLPAYFTGGAQGAPFLFLTNLQVTEMAGSSRAAIAQYLLTSFYEPWALGSQWAGQIVWVLKALVTEADSNIVL